MFMYTLRSVLVALVASAMAASATPGLSLKLSGADKVDGVNNLKVTTIVTNTGDETLKLLNDPRGPLNKLPTETFLIGHDETGAAPAFTGVKVKYVPATAARIGGDDAYTTLAPGQSASVEHDLSTCYDFTRTGPGSYSIAALVATPSDALVTDVSGKLAVTHPSKTKRATYNGCSSTEESQLTTAASAAQSYAASAYAYTNSHNASTTRFATWFGPYSTDHHSTVLTHFRNVNHNCFDNYEYDCTCTDSGTYAYVYPDDFGVVYLCGAFWTATVTGTDSQGGTLIHESTHFTSNAGTEDYAYGHANCQALATNDANEAVLNADSHEYYAENNPALA